MPIFDYKCKNCNSIKEDIYVARYDEIVTCECNEHMTKIPPRIQARCFPSEGIFFEHLSPEGETFYSKQEMLNYEKETGAYIDMAH